MSEQPAFSDLPHASAPQPLVLIFWGFVAAVVLGLLLFVGTSGPRQREMPSGTEDPLAGKQLAMLQLAPLTGDPPALLLKDLRDKVTLVNFWGTWCPPCQVEFPALEKLRDELSRDDDFRFVSVSCWPEKEDDIDKLRRETAGFLKTRTSDLPTYYDPAARTRIAVLDLMGENGMGYPMTILFDRQGIIRGVWHGYATGMEENVREVAQKVLSESET